MLYTRNLHNIVNQPYFNKFFFFRNYLVIQWLCFAGGTVVIYLPMQETQETWILFLGRGDSPGVGHGNPL